jgi:hypothetical protein
MFSADIPSTGRITFSPKSAAAAAVRPTRGRPRHDHRRDAIVFQNLLKIGAQKLIRS